MSATTLPPFRHTRAPSSWRRRAPACLLAALLALAASGVQARDEKDHDRVRDAVRAGQVMPFDALRERLRRTHPGDVLELELEREHERWIYEVTLLRPDGHIIRLEVDARSGEVLRERHGRRRRH